jgi:hypothetical protein
MPTPPPSALSLLLAGALCAGMGAPAAELEAKPADAAFAKFDAIKAPAPGGLLWEGDRLAIIGDSNSEQKQYSRIIET